MEDGEECLGKDEERLRRGSRRWRAPVDGWSWLSWDTGHRAAPTPLRQVALQGMEDAMGGRARPEGPWAAVLALRREGYECIPQCLGLLRHRRDLALAVLGFIGVQPLVDVSAAVL